MSVSDIFAQAVALEETNPSAALKLYDKLLAEDGGHAAAHINAGTLCYNSGRMDKAEYHYKRAISIDPDYLLAYFDLGNVLDETGRVPEAIKLYQHAVKLDPLYADAHYNLALALEKLNETGKALQHWQAYVKLDPASPWGKHARDQIARCVVRYGIRLVRSNPNPRRTKRRAKLVLVHGNQ